MARDQGVSLDNISSHGRYVLSSSFDREEYDQILNFLDVKPVRILVGLDQSCHLSLGSLVSIEAVISLLVRSSQSKLSNSGSSSISASLSSLVQLSEYMRPIWFQIGFGSSGPLFESSSNLRRFCSLVCNSSIVADQFFVPNITQEALQLYSKKQTIRERLLNEVKVEAINVYEYADLLTNSLTRDHKLSVDYADFFYHSLSENYLPE
ncbi:hypothetical protein ACSBR1_035473 [Camellia fascicularis]